MDFFNNIKSGNITKVAQHIEIDPSIVNRKDARGFTPLVMATYSDQIEIAKYLITQGAKINAQDGVIDDEDVELLTKWELKNKSDSVYHEKHVHRIVSTLSKSPYIAEDKITVVASSEIYHEYSKLKKVANAHELNKLLIHPSPIIRVYSHRALMENNYEPNTLHLEASAR